MCASNLLEFWSSDRLDMLLYNEYHQYSEASNRNVRFGLSREGYGILGEYCKGALWGERVSNQDHQFIGHGYTRLCSQSLQ